VSDSTLPPKKVQNTYDSLSGIYDFLTSYEGGAKRRGLEIADIRPTQNVLEVGFGTGRVLKEIAEKTVNGQVFGIDISRNMLRRTVQLLERSELSDSASLAIADGTHLPFRDGYFDKVFSSYTLDLMGFEAISKTLGEVHRVLVSGGRVVLVSLSKGKGWRSNMKLYEWLFRRSPSLLGGCRPLLLEDRVRSAGFINVRREFLMAGNLMPSEVIYAEKPA
jgi:ubiquinone/menaquinone biosynthesis C-methylase UbiE